MSDKKDPRIKTVVIAGAGCAGLAAGIALQKRGCKVTILESAGRVGGLAGGIDINGNIYEYGPHIFHTTDPEVLADVKRIAGHVLIPFKKSIKIKFLGKYFDFPLSIPDVITKLPYTTVVAAAFSFAKHYIKGLGQDEAALTNSEKVLQRYYGDVLYRIFFKDYITKVWGIEPSGMAASFAKERIPRLSILDFIDKLKKRLFGASQAKQISTEHYVERVEGENYTTKKGFSLIAEAFAEEFIRNGGTLKLNARVTGVKVEQGYCRWVLFNERSDAGPFDLTQPSDVAHGNGFLREQVYPQQQLPCDYFISTMPINRLPHLIEPALPPDVLQAASRLRFRALTFVGILVKKTKVLPASFMYFRDKIFNRITDLEQFMVEVKPEGATTLIAEIACQPQDPAWKNEKLATDTVVSELVAEGLIKPTDVLETHVFKVEHGYPIYEVGYEEALQTVLEALKQYKNLYTIGRQGKFAYINTHIAMKMGYQAARKITEEKGQSAVRLESLKYESKSN